MTALDWATTTTHQPVACPPDPNAVCKHCGDALEHHIPTDGPEETPTPTTAQCWDRDAFTERKAIRYKPFELDDGETLDCEHASFCEQCGVAICPEHSTAFTTCVDQRFTYHHLDCAEQCDDCMRAVAEAADEDRAIEQWKGVA